MSKECVAIWLAYDDGTAEIIKQGCAIAIAPDEDSDDMIAKVTFANGDKKEIANVFCAMASLVGADRQ